MTFFSAVVLLGVLIFVHELGHFITAKKLGVKVLKFSLGFGPKLLSRKYGETEYLISSVPLGGYVKMLGQSDLPEEEEEIPEAEKHRAYNFQPVWKRSLIVLSGPLFNLFFAVAVFFFIYLAGVPTLLPETGEILEGTPAEQAGILKGDTIIEVNGRRVESWADLTEAIHASPGKTVSLMIKRDKDVLALSVVPERKVIKNIFGEGKEVGLIGIKPSGKTLIRKEPLFSALTEAFYRTWDISVLTLVSIIKLIQRIIPADTIGGPILIFQMAGQQAEQGVLSFFTFMALISINLGILNLLPIPVLDGGHLLFLAIETIRKKPLDEKVIIIAQRIGIALLVTLMAFAFYNDIMRLITGKTFS